ncbi:MAG TPA: oligopeptide transporter, OPT family, partial [Thermoanaerobaculia bacterium]|nr:oligopeptide transporter, OPT family [Thermoanaerobaculia bacterium]
MADQSTFKPYVSSSESPAEFTLRAVVPGIIFGVVFGAANAYLGLRAGLTISTSIPIAVMTVAAFKIMAAAGHRGSILEANISQTTGSASSSVASGVIFTIPALFLWGLDPTLLQMTLLAFAGGMLGVLFMIPLRKLLIEREHGKLPYPEGTACAEVLMASEVGGSRAKNVFAGLGVGALFKTLAGGLHAFPDRVETRIPFLPKGQVGAEVSAALFGVGYILGPYVASVMVSGGLLSSLVIIPIIATWGEGRTVPFYPETALTIAEMSASQIWSRYVRYIGAGAVAAAGILTLIRSIPTMMESFKVGFAQIRGGGQDASTERTTHDLPFKVSLIGAGFIVVLLVVFPQAFGTIDDFAHRAVAAVCVAIFAFFFVTVSSRIVGLVGVTSNPTSGMTIAALLGTSAIFLFLGWTDNAGKVAALTVGTVVAIAASIAGDMSQDLKTGFLLGATPRRQQ